MQVKKLFAAAAALLAISPAFASDQLVDGVYGEFSAGSKIKMGHIGVTKDWPSNWSWFESNGRHLTGYWDATLGYWEGRQANNVPGAKTAHRRPGLHPGPALREHQQAGLLRRTRYWRAPALPHL
ncbi:hypothetical protein ACHMW6_00500 [Pseudoduganella sp. UC29_106]|uniref:hypothetical protein n=1 Tax=Pseudoduganella sp. UC29_106 TaxID=3374553 RepID=UPI00375792C2